MAYKSASKRYKIVPEQGHDFPKVKIHQASAAVEFCRQFYFEDITVFESFFILMLNRANNTIGYAKISQGGTAGTTVDIKMVAKFATDSLAHGLILCHNHPSGNVSPSPEDLAITTKIVRALELFGVKVLDHIILTEDDYYSMADNGTLRS